MASPRLPYTVAQVADMYGMGVEAVRREIRSGRLPASHKRGQSRKWYVTDADLETWAATMLEGSSDDG